MSNKIFRIEIIQPRFDELYRQYEGSFNRADTQKQYTLTRKNQAVIKPKTLELMAKELGNLFTGTELIDFLTECGVERNAIEYPQTKWRMVYDVFLKLATSDNNDDKTVLFKIIGEAVHPLSHNGNTASAKNLLNKFNNLLSYENGSITFDDEENTYKVYLVPSKKEQAEIMAEFHEELAEEERKQQEFLCQPENKEKISLLRKTYQALMGVVEVFCRNFSHLSQDDIVELNRRYLALDKSVWGLVDELKLGGSFDAYKKYPRPFSNLFSAEKELSGDIEWDTIRREMSARFGEIETLYQQVNASDVLTEPDQQKQLNDIALYLSELNEKVKEAKEKEIIEAIKSGGVETKQQGVKPYCLVEGVNGYFKFYKEGEKILVGKASSRHFRLLRCLCEPHFGVQKGVEAVFEAIRKPKDKQDSRLADFNPQRKTRMLELIEFAKKELQKKNKKLQGKLKYNLDAQKNNIWLSLEG